MICAFEQRLLDWLVHLDPASESLCGDLSEGLATGRSHLWFFGQLLNAGGVTITRHVCQSKRATAEAVALGAGMTGVLLFAAYVTLTLGLVVGTLAWRALFS